MACLTKHATEQRPLFGPSLLAYCLSAGLLGRGYSCEGGWAVNC